MGCRGSKPCSDDEQPFHKSEEEVDLLDVSPPMYEPTWAEKAEKMLMRRRWAAHGYRIFPGMVSVSKPYSSFTRDCLEALRDTRNDPPTKEEFTEAFLTMIKGNETQVLSDFGDCELRQRVEKQMKLSQVPQ